MHEVCAASIWLPIQAHAAACTVVHAALFETMRMCVAGCYGIACRQQAAAERHEAAELRRQQEDAEEDAREQAAQEAAAAAEAAERAEQERIRVRQHTRTAVLCSHAG